MKALTSPRKGTAYISLLSVLAAIAVVILHTNGCYWRFSTQRYWITANVINSVFIFAVPVFFMISGATLMDYRRRYDTAAFFKKRLTKTVIPFLVWSLLCLVLEWRYFRSFTTADLSLQFILNGLASSRFNSVYWFFWPLFGCYLAMPLFSAVPQESRKSLFTYLVTAAAILNIGIPFFLRLAAPGVQWPLSLGAVGGYLIYLLIGWLIAGYEMPRWLRWVIYALGVAGVAAYIIGTQVLSFREGRIVDTYKGYTNVPCLCYSVAVFVFFRQTGDRLMACRPVRACTEFLQGYTFPVYLLHMPLLRIMAKELGFDTRSIVWRLGGFVVIVPLCILITWVVRRIPLVRRILP